MQRESSPDTLRSLQVYVLVCAQVCVYVEVGGWHCPLQLLSSWFFNQSIIVCVYVPQRMCGGQRRACRLSFQLVGAGDSTQVIRLSPGCLDPLSRLPGPHLIFEISSH